MIRALLALFRPLYTIAKELAIIRELYELELRERHVNPQWAPMPLSRVTEKPKKGDVEVNYFDENADQRKHKQVDWEDEDEFDPGGWSGAS